MKIAALPAANPGRGRLLEPQEELEFLAARLVAAHEDDPGNAMLARELLVTLQALSGHVRPAEDEVDRIRREWERGG